MAGLTDAGDRRAARLGAADRTALQLEYSLIERTTERDLIPMAREMGLGVLPWSPLAKGVLTGKYTRADLDHPDSTQTRRFVHPGREWRAWAGARSDYESDSGGVLAARHKSGDPQAPS